MGEPHPIDAGTRPRLGELLVQRGLLTPEQLAEVLTEQQASGLPMGAILVRDGLVASHTVALLLAEQSGGPLKTEFGYAVGAAPVERSEADVLSLHPAAAPEPPVSEPALDGLRLAFPESQPQPEPPPALVPVPALREIPAAIPEAAPQPAAVEPDARDLGAELAAEVAARDALEQKLADVEAGTEAALAGRAALEQDIAALRQRAETSEATVREMQGVHAELHDRLAALELRVEESAVVRACEARTTTGRPYTSERHILLAPVADRYELVERPGPPPETGSRIELFDNRSYLVVRVGPAPIPGALEACAYLEPIPTRFPPRDADTELT